MNVPYNTNVLLKSYLSGFTLFNRWTPVGGHHPPTRQCFVPLPSSVTCVYSNFYGKIKMILCLSFRLSVVFMNCITKVQRIRSVGGLKGSNHIVPYFVAHRSYLSRFVLFPCPVQVSDNKVGCYTSTIKCFYEAISLTETGGNISFGGGDLRQEGFRSYWKVK